MTNSTLDYALMAFDSYFRGNQPDIIDLPEVYNKIESEVPIEHQEIGFDASVYLTGGEVVISYRGTDLDSFLPLFDSQLWDDIMQGWSAGLGVEAAQQVEAAIRFYQTVKEEFPSQKIVLTGHSLGGGLAGMVAALYGEEAVIFDNMTFETLTNNIHSLSTAPVPNQDLKSLVYGENTPSSPDFSGVTPVAVDGEVLQYTRLLQQTPESVLTLSDQVDLSIVQKHSMSLLSLLEYAQTGENNNQTDWRAAEKFIIEALFDETSAAAAGIEGRDQLAPADVLKAMLAYSTIQDGTIPFGDQAAKAWFQDINTYGEAFQAELATFGYGGPNAVRYLQDALNIEIATAVTQYAGVIARNQNTASDWTGILNHDETNRTLTVDYSEDAWNALGEEPLEDYDGDGFLAVIADFSGSSFWTHLADWSGHQYGGTIEKFTFATGFGGTWQLEAGSDFSAFYGTGSSDNITGSISNELIFTGAFGSVGSGITDVVNAGAGNDFVIAGDGKDELDGEEGNDVLVGGAGDDTFIGSEGADLIFGGDVGSGQGGGKDTLDFSEHAGGLNVSFTLDGAGLLERGTVTSIGGGDVSTQTYSIEKFILTSEDDQAILQTLGTDVTLAMGLGDNTVAVGDQADQADSPSAITRIDFDLENATERQTQTIIGDKDLDRSIASNGVLTFNGKQIVGGAAFDFNRYEKRTNDFQPYTSLLGDLQHKAVLLTSDWQAAKTEAVGRLLALAGDLTEAGAGLGTPGTGYGAGLGLGTFFGTLAIEDAMRWDLKWLDAYSQEIIGAHGEIYRVFDQSTGNRTFDVTNTGVYRLEIEFRGGNFEEPQTIVVNNWRQGDFGVSLHASGLENGYDTGTNRNGKFDPVTGPQDNPQIQATLASLGLVPPTADPVTPPAAVAAAAAASTSEGGSAPSASPDDGPLLRNGNDADNHLSGTDGADQFNGGRGNDVLSGGEGVDTYVFARGDGANVIFDASTAGNVMKFVDIEVSSLAFADVPGDTAGVSDRQISFGDGDTVLIKNWSLLDQAAQDAWAFETLASPALTPDTEDELPNLVTYPSELTGTEAADTIDGGNREDVIDGAGGDDTLIGAGGNDQIFGGTGRDTLFGGTGNDRLFGGDDADVISGGTGDDYIESGNGADEITGGQGDDRIIAGDGGSNIYFNAGDGQDTITVNDSTGLFSNGPQTDTLVFGEGILAADVRLARSPETPESLTFEIGNTGDRLIITNQFDAYGNDTNGLDFVRFADGEVWDRAQLKTLVLAHTTTPGDDTLVGFEQADDVIAATAGDDLLSGVSGNDTYHWNRGSGDDVITDSSGHDRLVFGPTITPDDVALEAIRGAFDHDLKITVSGAGGGSVLIKNLMNKTGEGVDKIVFDDGTFWTADYASELVAAGELTSNGNTVFGGAYDDQLVGSPENDALYGGGGNDILLGGAGNDTLFGFNEDTDIGSHAEARDGNDVLNGGSGNDVLFGSYGNNRYEFDAGFGQDQIRSDFSKKNTWGDHGGRDTVVFTAHTLSDFTVSFSPSSDDPGKGTLTWQVIGASDRLDIIDHPAIDGVADKSDFVTSYQFADGEVVEIQEIAKWVQIAGGAQANLMGTAADDTLSGTGGSDVLSGANGNDVLDGGAGADVLIAGGGNDRLSGGVGDDVLFGNSGADTITAGRGNDHLSGGGGDDTLAGDIGNDQLDGGAGADRLSGGAGNDTLNGGAGSDAYYFSRGDGQDIIHAASDTVTSLDKLVLNQGIPKSVVTYSFDDADLVINFSNGSYDQITIKDYLGNGYLSIQFVDGTTDTAREVLATITGATDAGENTSALPNADQQSVISGGKGNDLLYENDNVGKDTFVFVKGDGQDQVLAKQSIFIAEAHELLVLGYDRSEAQFIQDGESVSIQFAGTGDKILLADQLAEVDNWGVDQIIFGTGGVLSRADLRQLLVTQQATNGDDVITASSTETYTDFATTIDGGKGDDTLVGSKNSDTYVYELGDGSDVVEDASISNATDTLSFGPGIHSRDLAFSRSNQVSEDVVITLLDGNTITLAGQMLGTGEGIEQIRFADGSTLSGQQIRDQILVGSAGVEDDVLTGTVAADTLSGGAGVNTLIGGEGGDTYIVGGGQDTVIETGTSGVDQLRFADGIKDEDVLFWRDPVQTNDLMLTLLSGETVRVTGQFSNNAIEKIVFADGKVIDAAGIGQRVVSGSQTEGSDYITGTDSDDRIAPGAGNDVIELGNGADIIEFGRGDGQDRILLSQADNGEDQIVLGAGIAAAEVALTINGQDLVLSIHGASDTLTISEYFDTSGGAPIVMGKLGTIAFEDGTIWQSADILSKALDTAPIVNGEVADQAIDEDAPFVLQLPIGLFTDAETQALVLTATLSDGAPLPTWLSFENGIFSGIPQDIDTGSLDIVVTATDEAGKQAVAAFRLQIDNVNDEPVLLATTAPISAIPGQNLSYVFDSTQISDPDGGDDEQLSYSAELADGQPLPTWLTFNAETLTFSGTVPAEGAGILSVHLLVSDGAATLTVPLHFVTQTDVVAPVVASPLADMTISEDEIFSFTLPDDVFTDTTPNDALTFAAALSDGSSLPDWLQFDPATGSFSGNPANLDVGGIQIKVTATDLAGNSADTTFLLTVNGTNDAPIVTGAWQSYVATEGELLDWTPDYSVFVDPDQGDQLTYSAVLFGGEALPDWLSFDGHKFTGTPEDADTGVIALTVIATDTSGATAQNSFYMIVGAVNDAPIAIGEIANKSLHEDEAIAFTLPAELFDDPDNSGVGLTVTLDNGDLLPNWIFYDPVTREFQIDPPSSLLNLYEGIRTYTIQVTATDALGASTHLTFDVSIYDDDPGTTITGTDGNDQLLGSFGPDVVDGGAGDDLLQGSYGKDTFLFGPGSGNDIIDPDVPVYSDDSVGDIIRFTGNITVNDIDLSRTGSNDALTDLVITIRATGETLTVLDQFGNYGQASNVVTRFEFEDGTVWTDGDVLSHFAGGTDQADILLGDAFNNTIFGDAGDDEIRGSLGDDILNGGAGSDLLDGGSGDDTYILQLGDGIDTIAADSKRSDINILRFGDGIVESDLVNYGNLDEAADLTIPVGIDLKPFEMYIGLADGSAGFVVVNQFKTSWTDDGISKYEFHNGATYLLSQLVPFVSASNGGGLSVGTSGDDTLRTAFGDTTFSGGAGNDILEGGAGNDTFLYNLGDGNDTMFPVSDHETNRSNCLRRISGTS